MRKAVRGGRIAPWVLPPAPQWSQAATFSLTSQSNSSHFCDSCILKSINGSLWAFSGCFFSPITLTKMGMEVKEKC